MNEIIVPGFGKRFLGLFPDLTQTQIAEMIGVSKPAITNYVQDRVPKLQILFKILEQRPCSLDWLLKGEEKKADLLPFQTQAERKKNADFVNVLGKEDWNSIKIEDEDEGEYLKAKLWFSEWVRGYFGFEESEAKVIQEIADAGGISFEETVGHLVREALAMKGIGSMPDFMPVPVFQMMNDEELFRRLDTLPEQEKKAETQRLIGALMMKSVGQP